MSTISTQTRRELVKVVRDRYLESSLADKGRILDEFIALTGYHRKHAIRVLRSIDLEAGLAITAFAPLRRGGPRSARAPVGGVRPHLRQAAQAAPADPAPGAREARPPVPRRGRARASARRQRSHHRSAARESTCNGAEPSQAASSAARITEHPGSHLRRLEATGARLPRDRPRRPLRRQPRRELRAHACAHRHREWLDRVRRPVGAREHARRRRPRPAQDHDAVPASWHRQRQRQRVHQRDAARLLRQAAGSSSRARGPTARTTRRGWSRRTARWCAVWSATVASKGCVPSRRSRGCTPSRGCS